MADPEPIEAELVDEPAPRRRAAAEPKKEAAPLRVELDAWPKLLRARCVITERGKRRELTLDGSLVAILLNYLSTLR
ncbi:MAG TPA: hypothetical protein VN915_06830 [Elusimicrobiota bacterium]|nr:hypothetical protein [Elusimicrobiota bacterium]